MNATDVTLPEELLLLGFRPDTGRPRGRKRHVEYAMAGAALAELEAAGHISQHGGRVSVVDPRTTGDPLLDGALALLPPSHKDVRARQWIKRTCRQIRGLTAQRLAKRGAIRIVNRRALGLFPYDLYPSAGTDWSAQALARFQGAAKTGFPDPRSRTVAGLVSAAGLDSRVHPGSGDARRVRKEMRGFAHDQWAANAVRKVIKADNAAASS